MYLYERKEKEICIYVLNPSTNKILDYRQKEMENFNSIFFTAETDATSPNKILEKSNIVKLDDLNIKNSPIFMPSDLTAYTNKFHTFKTSRINGDILNNFYLGMYDYNNVVTVYKENIIPNFQSSIFDISKFRGIGMEGIINNEKNFLITLEKGKLFIIY